MDANNADGDWGLSIPSGLRAIETFRLPIPIASFIEPFAQSSRAFELFDVIVSRVDSHPRRLAPLGSS